MNIRLTIRSKMLISVFGVLFIAGAILLIFNMTAVYDKLEERLLLRGVTIANLMAQDVINRILTENYIDIELMLRERLADEQDIEYAFVRTNKGAIVAHTFEYGFPAELKDINYVPAGQDYAIMRFETDRSSLIDIARPLLKGELGQLHIGLSATTIRNQTEDIIFSIIWLIPVTMIAAGVVFTILARYITRPLLALAETVEQASHSSLNVQADVSSQDEIGDLARSFNDMISARRKIEQDREEIISRLQAALQEVRTLSGLLPICAWCKKIRDDRGYWQQIEGYISRHTEAVFSHGICPDCLKEVSRETYERLDAMQKDRADGSDKKNAE